MKWNAHATQHDTIPELDKALNNYTVHLYQSGIGKATADKTVYGVIMFIPTSHYMDGLVFIAQPRILLSVGTCVY